jgi:hypothetical protein
MKKNKSVEDIYEMLKKDKRVSKRIHKKVLGDMVAIDMVMKKHQCEMAALFGAILQTYQLTKDMDDFKFKEMMVSVVATIYAEGYMQGMKDTMKGGDK